MGNVLSPGVGLLAFSSVNVIVWQQTAAKDDVWAANCRRRRGWLV